MYKQTQGKPRLTRIVRAALPRESQLHDWNVFLIRSFFDVLQRIDRLPPRRVYRLRHLLMEVAERSHRYSDNLPHYITEDLRRALTNNAVNLAMLVSDVLAARGDQKGSDEAFDAAYRYVKDLARPPQDQLFREKILDVFDYKQIPGMLSLRCDVEKARQRLFDRYLTGRKFGFMVTSSLGVAVKELKEAERLRDSVLELFELDLGLEVAHFRPTTPECLNRALSAIAFGHAHIRSIEQLEPSQGTFSRANRAAEVCRLVRAYVQGCLGEAYAEYWKGAPGLKDFGVLADQAVNYARLQQRENWTYFAPLVMIKPEEPLIEESGKDLQHLVRLGEAAYANGLNLHAQMLLLPERLRLPAFRQVVEKAPGVAPVEPMTWPGLHFMVDGQQGTQEEIASKHCCFTGEDFKDLYYFTGRCSYHPLNLKRLVGFVEKRGGRRYRRRGSKK